MSTLRPTTISEDVNQNLDGTMRAPSNGSTAGNMMPAGDATRRPSEPMQNNTVLNNDSDFFTLKGEKYHNQKCLSDNSGEAQVFLVDKDGSDYVLKVYYPNFDVNRKLLQTIHNFDLEMIVSLIDYGIPEGRLVGQLSPQRQSGQLPQNSLTGRCRIGLLS